MTQRGTIKRRGESWQVDFTGDDGKRCRHSYKTEVEAEAKLRALRASLRGVGDGRVHTLQDALELSQRTRWGTARGGYSQLINARTAVAYFGPDKPLPSITRESIRDWTEELEDIGNSDGTINRKVSALSVMLKDAAVEGWIDSVPHMKRRAERKTRVRWLSKEEEDRLTQTMRILGEDACLEADLIQFLCDTGLRIQIEALRLTKADFREPLGSSREGSGRCSVYVSDGKGGKARTVPLTKRAERIFREWSTRTEGEQVFPIRYDELRHRLERAKAHTGIADVTIHTCRHTFGSRLAQRNVRLIKIKELMGHTDIKTTMIYAHLSTEHLFDAVEALEDA